MALLAVAPFLVLGMALQAVLVSKFTTEKLEALSKAGQAAEEIIANIKIVKSSSTEYREAKRYGKI